ncbi:MAG: GNAT family N-acetyltransferase [Chloroflexi bacterium]|nr:GNAT family N-acetyltransferase [Chloroflexota bacterium]
MTAVDDEIACGTLIRLRRKRLSDAQTDYDWRRDPELSRFDAASPLRSSFQEFLTTFTDDLRYPSPFRRVFAIENLEGEHIGNVMYYNIDDRRGEAELGITIGVRRYWSQGYGTDAVTTFIHYLFTETGLRRVYLNTLDWNVRAQRAFRKAGFRAIGMNRRGFHTFLTMEIKREWFTDTPDTSRSGDGGLRVL